MLKLFRKRKTAEADGMVMPLKSKTQLLIPGGSGQNASLGGVSGFTVEIVQQGPGVPAGSSSKFSLQIVPVHGVAVGVGWWALVSVSESECSVWAKGHQLGQDPGLRR